jgi:hypothetical protein
MSANIESMSRSEILEAAQALRQSSPDGLPRIFTNDESAIIQAADMITNERKSSGITGLIESAVAAVRGERVAAEMALQKAREREGKIETLLQQQSGIESALEMERQALATIKKLIADYAQRTSPEAEGEAMTSRWHFRHDPRFPEHLVHAVAHIANNRLIAQALPLYLAKSKAEIERLEVDVKEIKKQISKAR